MSSKTDQLKREMPVREAWSKRVEDVLDALEVDPAEGLGKIAVIRRCRRYGRNRLHEKARESAWSILLNQFKNLIVLLLLAAMIVSFAVGSWMDGIAIGVVIAINTVIGFITELRAVRSMEALRKLGDLHSKVRRGGVAMEIPAKELVPGDIIIIEGGDIATADLRLIEASKLQADESALTGESAPVSKRIDPVDEKAPLAERSSMLFKGTSVTRGSGEGVVVATGMATELGQIASMVEEAEEEATPLERRLNELGNKLIWVTLVVAVIVAATGIFSGKSLYLMIETAIALAVAAIPEGLPIVATIALARGMWRMAKRNALINRLSAVETLGATDVICTDKTGTLTENRMTVVKYELDTGVINVRGESHGTGGSFHADGEPVSPEDNKLLLEALRVGVLCNNASIDKTGDKPGAVGEPVEVALLYAADKAGIDRKELSAVMEEVREEAFDPERKMMATWNRSNGKLKVFVKGAPEEVLKASTRLMTSDGYKEFNAEARERWFEKNRLMARDGLRLLALAVKEVDSDKGTPYENLAFIGLVGMIDPPKEEVRWAIEECHSAGVRVVMVTGDQAGTARNVALATGLIKDENTRIINGGEYESLEGLAGEEFRRVIESDIFARINPREKLELISLHQGNGSIVAMTGDGVNDAPALRKADIGIAMGRRGTQVAAEAADMVLKDDEFSTIVAAIAQGRVIFTNIRKFVLYLLSCNISEVLSVGVASLIQIPLPILPLQILFLNLVTDVFPALALGAGEGDAGIMRHPPREPDEPVMTRPHWYAVGFYGLLITASVIVSLILALRWLGLEEDGAITISFLTLAFAQLWQVFNVRETSEGIIRNDVVRNPFVWLAIGLSGLLLIVALYVPGLSEVLRLHPPDSRGWTVVIVLSLMPLVIGQTVKVIASFNRQSRSGEQV